MKSTTNRPASRAGNRAVAGKRANSTSSAAVEGHLSRLIGEKGTGAQDSTCCHPNVTKRWQRKEHDRFQVITEHTKASLPFDREYLGIHRSDDCVFFQITLNSGRSTELKQRFYKALADHLYEGVKIRKEDVLINFVEVPKENWSFGNGEAQYVTPPK